MSEWAFVEHVTTALARPRSGDSKHPTLWPSEATATYENEHGETVVVGKCRRARFFRYLIDCYKFYEKYSVWKPLVERLITESKPPDKYMLWIWAQGNLYEEYLIEQAKKSGVFVDEQVPLYIKSHNVSGKKDIEVINPQNNLLSIVEAKSVYGHGANSVLGKPSDRAKGRMGVPRDSNLMQIGIYDWWCASQDEAYEDSRLVYGSRDTGRYAEYRVRSKEVEGKLHLQYKPWHPYMGDWVTTPITINSILDEYAATQTAVDSGKIPDRDFDARYSEEKLAKLHARGEFGKTDAEKYEKNKARKELNKLLRSLKDMDDDELLETVAANPEAMPAAAARDAAAYFTLKIDAETLDDDQIAKQLEKAKAKALRSARKIEEKKELTEFIKGDWQCKYCKFAPICYDEDGRPQDIT